jgi:hypothetical protein
MKKKPLALFFIDHDVHLGKTLGSGGAAIGTAPKP